MWPDLNGLRAYKNDFMFSIDYKVYQLTVVDEWVYWFPMDNINFQV